MGALHTFLLLAALSPASPDSLPHQARALRVTVLSTMLTDHTGVGEWGFAALVEVDGRRLLFDTGERPETVLQNARELGIDLSTVTDIVLSHHHADHAGGLLRKAVSRRRQNVDEGGHRLLGSSTRFSRTMASIGDGSTPFIRAW